MSNGYFEEITQVHFPQITRWKIPQFRIPQITNTRIIVSCMIAIVLILADPLPYNYYYTIPNSGWTAIFPWLSRIYFPAGFRLVRIAYPYCSKAQYGSAISTAKSINRKNRTSQTASLRMVSLEKIHVQWLIERQTLLPMLATKKINQNLLQSTKI